VPVDGEGSFLGPDRPLALWQRAGIVLLGAGFLILGTVVELRSAFMQRRMTDLDVYLRAAWAVRDGEDLYAVTDDSGWHYHYPSLLAILLVPLADQPAGAASAGAPYLAIAVADRYVFC